MRDLLCDYDTQEKLPKFLVCRLFVRPDRTFIQRPIGVWRAVSNDEAIRKAAFAIRRLALLKAYRLR